MPRGQHPHAYFATPDVDKPIEEVYADLDSFTDEVFARESAHQLTMSTFVALPPVRYRGKFVKGILFTHAADLLVERNPRLKEVFFVFAYSMWCSIPRSVHADGLFTLYKNPERERWFKRNNQARAQQLWLPLEDADFFNHYHYAPEPRERDIDVLCVARPDAVKNLPMFAAAVRRLQKGYGDKRLKCVLVTGREVDVNLSQLFGGELEQMREVQRTLGAGSDALFIEPHPVANLAATYGRARCLVLPSLIEGKNRAIHEAASCDTPIVTFAAFNQFARGGHPVLPERAGVSAPTFSADSLADTVHAVLADTSRFAPREAVLEVSGRRRVLEACIDALPYYRDALPGYEAGRHLDNAWLDLAMWQTYRQSLHQHLFAPHPSLVWTKGLEAFEAALNRVVEAVGWPEAGPQQL